MAQEATTTGTGGYGAAARDGETTRSGPVFRPVTDIYETDKGVVVLAEMPGVGPDDLEIMLDRRVLTIRGRAAVAAPEGYRQVYREYATGDFERVFTVSEDIDGDGIRATQKNGVLILELPKAAPAQARRIDVTAT